MDPTQAAPIDTHDFSFLGLFLQADPIVKGVMILLVIASIALVKSHMAMSGRPQGP